MSACITILFAAAGIFFFRSLHLLPFLLSRWVDVPCNARNVFQASCSEETPENCGIRHRSVFISSFFYSKIMMIVTQTENDGLIGFGRMDKQFHQLHKSRRCTSSLSGREVEIDLMSHVIRS